MRRLSIVALVLIASTAPAFAVRFVRSDALAARRSIDATCDLAQFDRRATRTQLARVHDARHGDGPWLVAGDAQLAKLQGLENGAYAADIADAFTRDGAVVYAIYRSTTPSASGDYCYVHGKLVRASFDMLDANADESLGRKLYFDTRGNLFADTGTVIDDVRKRRNALVAATPKPEDEIRIAPYATPHDLPFYAAYRAARAGSLPKLP